MESSSSEASREAAQASAQASSWFARLNAPSVSVADLRAFQSWRERPEHDRAYRKVEAVWARGDQLMGDPDIAAALTAAFNKGAAMRPPRLAAPAVGLAAAAIAAMLGLYAYTDGAFGARTYETQVGQERSIPLADGSEVRLDTNSQIAVRLGVFRRRLTLVRGRAFFAVAHDPGRPFVVSAGETQVSAVGTRFSVDRENAQVRVILVQGVVSVSSQASPTGSTASRTLAAGQQVTADGSISAPAPVDLGLATSWLRGQLVFRDMPLRDAIAEVNRYAVHKITLVAPGAVGVPVSGVFNAGDPGSFAAAAAEVCGLDVVFEPDGQILLRAKEPSGPG